MTTQIKTKNALRGQISGLFLLLALCLTGPAVAPAAFAQEAPPAPPELPALSPAPVLNAPAPDPLALLTNVPPPPPLPAGTAVVTDQSDYAPGATAHIRGQEFQAGETVSLQVLHADGTSDGGEDHQPWTVVADSNGAFQATWHVCEDDCVGSTLRLTATGLTSGRTAQVLFTDAPAAPIYEQLKAFGKPSPGAYPFGGLIKGTDGALYGTAYQGGSSGQGVVFKLNTDGTGFTVLKSFDYSTSGANPYGKLVQGTDGTLYGTAHQGGSSSYGTVFKLNTDGTGFTVLKGDFDYSTTGGYLFSGLMQGTDGALYGTTVQGGSSGYGTVFKLNTDGTGFSVLKNFDYSTTGGYLYSGLMQGTDGALYGTAHQGGSSGAGTVFKLNPDGSSFSVLKNFDYSTSGGYPFGSELIQGSDGALYGTAIQGGSSGYGTVFKLNLDGTGFSVLKNFDNYTTGGYLYSGLMQGTDGALYGTAYYGGSSGSGTVFKLDTDGSDFAVLHNFNYSDGGYLQGGELIQGPDGTLYGTAYQGGSSGYGTVFKLNTDGSDFSVLKNLSYGADISEEGGYLYSGVIQGADGTLYGTTYQGGSSGAGTVFKMNSDGTGHTILKNLDYSTTGGYPYGGALIQGTDGALYGTASQGGSSGYGTVFKLNTDGTGFTILKHFDYSSGGYLYSGLMQGTDGALYGTAYYGGSSGSGTVFKLDTDGSDFAVLHNFYYSDGGYLQGGELIQGADGTLYGTASQGGSYGGGTVFKLNPDGSGFTVLQNIGDGSNGYYLFSGLMLGADGALYGTTYYGGGIGNGTLYKLNTDGSGFTVIHSFGYSDGGYLQGGGLVQRADGTIYGTAYQGGSSGAGTVFQLNPDGTDFSVFLNFDNAAIGGYPFGKLIQGTDGNLYGTTANGGNGAGTVFRLLFTAPNTAPTAVFPAGSPLQCNAAHTVTVQVSDPDGDALTATWSVDGVVFGAPHSLASGATSDSITKLFGFGQHTVSVSVDDGAGGTTSADITILVEDNESPVITGCPANITVQTGPGRTTCDQVATWTAPTASDNCTVTSFTSTHAPGDTFPVGTTTVTYTAEDAAGHETICSFTVTVEDNTPPVITTCLAAASVPFGGEPAAATTVAEFLSQGGDVSDNCGLATVTSSDSVAGLCPTIVTRTYTITDTSGNEATCVQTITVNNLFAADGILWLAPLAQSPANEDTDPSNVNPDDTKAGALYRYGFKVGSTIPIKIRATGCSGDVTANSNVRATVALFTDVNCDGVGETDLPETFSGVGGAGGAMVLTDGNLHYNLKTTGLTTSGGCLVLQVTVTDDSTGESSTETVLLKAK